MAEIPWHSSAAAAAPVAHGVVGHGRNVDVTLVDHPVCGPLVRSGLLVGVAFALEVVLRRGSALPAAAYEKGLLVMAQLRILATSGAPGVLALAAGALLLGAAIRSRSLGPRWTDLEPDARLRWLVGTLVALLAFVFATHDYNFYFDRGYWFERTLVVTLVPLVVWRPAFTLVFLAALLPIGWQFFHPIGGFSWAPASLPIRVVNLFAAWWLLRLVTRRVRTADFVFVLCCLIAAHYWVSGWGKLRLGWVATDQVGFLLPSTYANGWLGFLDPTTIGALARALGTLNVPMKAGTLLVECGALLMLSRRTTVRWFLLAAIALHIAIFALTGIGFWLWTIVDALVLILVFGRRRPDVPIFTRPHFALAVILIGGGAIWFRPTPLVWLDARATYTYRLEAISESGNVHTLPPAFFAPYDYQFTLGGFRYLVDAPRLAITWGATHDARLAAALNAARTPERILALESELGRNDYDAARAARFDTFIRGFVGTWQRRGGRSRWLSPLQAPATLWTFPRADPGLDGERIQRVDVYEMLSFFDGRRYAEIRRTPVRTIPVESEP
ncbi:MAG: hypothetical protein ACREM1_19050 [Longimicrobiales bacterium]